MLKTVYLVASGTLVAWGIGAVGADFPQDSLAGFSPALIGVVHILHWAYGRAAAGIRRVAVAMGPAFLAVLLWIGLLNDAGAAEIVFVLLLVTPSALALSPAVSHVPPAPSDTPSPGHVPAALSAAYFLAAAGVAATGVHLAAEDLLMRPFLFGFGVMAACSFWLVAVVNILNWRYGPALPGLRWSVAAVNVALLIILWNVEWTAAASDSVLEQLMFVWVPVLVTLLSVLLSVLSGRSGLPASTPGTGAPGEAREGSVRTV